MTKRCYSILLGVDNGKERVWGSQSFGEGLVGCFGCEIRRATPARGFFIRPVVGIVNEAFIGSSMQKGMIVIFA